MQEAEKINSFGSALPDYVNPKVELQIIHESTETHDFGWVFFYNSKKYIETKDISDALGGNAPLIVDNSNQNNCHWNSTSRITLCRKLYTNR